MSTRAIIDVEIQDAAWAKFQAQYKAYEDALAASPAAWKKVNSEIDGSRASFDKLVEAASARLVSAKLNADAEKVAADQLKRQTGETTTQARGWSSLAKDSKAFAGHVVDATKSLLQWSGVVTAVSGLIGAGGLFGIDRLAQSVAGERKESSGIRVTPGELQSFKLNFGRVLDNPAGFLTGVSESLSDVTKAGSWVGVGLNYVNERNKKPADAATDFLLAEKRLADQTPQSQMGNVFSSRQIGMTGQSLEDFQRIKDRPLAELLDYIKSNKRDSRSLDLDPVTQKKWDDFKVQLERAGDMIEKTFVVGLTKLTAPLGHLSDSFVHVVDAFAGSDRLKSFIDEIAVGMDAFAGKIGSDEFAKSVTGFADSLGTLASNLKADLPGITTVFNAVAAIGNGIGAVAGPWVNGRPPDPNNPLPNDPPSGQTPAAPPFSWLNPGSWLHHSAYRAPLRPGAPAELSPAAFRPGNFSGDISPVLLASVEYQESRGRDVTNPRSGAAGYFQFMPATARQYGVDVHNEASSLAGATRYLNDLKRQFGGDTEKALAAYNWGPGNLKRDIDRYGADWKRHLPRETAQYIAQIEGRLPKTAPVQYGHQFKDRSVQVQIHNNTGGNAHVTASMLSA
ncbi:lytic transglycosylase domain-containing protein [Acidisphaera sp. S103]|uniref:lytic transglycosylase domain-containing protein n=1 Tax=Acidisphaera sp. S103 TaxID=1747223 RepID=UPI00131CE4F5|nr:transglycosylase SLT domain-containing protein [Acidisphaera sp. S103]